MKDHIEPLSKCALLEAIRDEAANMARAELAAETGDAQDAALVYDTAAARLLAHVAAAEECGLMNELAGFLTATYGG